MWERGVILGRCGSDLLRGEQRSMHLFMQNWAYALKIPPAGTMVIEGSWLSFGKANPESLTRWLDDTLNPEVHKETQLFCFGFNI